MSNGLAIAAVTATLRNLIDTGLQGLDLASSIGGYSISAWPPDRVTTGQTEVNQLNLFMYQVLPNAAWRNQGLPERHASGQRTSNPPLALDLHYLMSAYGADEFSADALLGLGMQVLHDKPGLDRQQLRQVLAPPATPFGPLSAASLAEQIEWLKITPQYLDTEELSKLWTAAQARYRPSMAYQVSVVLIQSEQATRAAVPVLKRGENDRGPFAVAGGEPRLDAVQSAASDQLRAARLGDELLLSGRSLALEGTEVVFQHAREPVTHKRVPEAAEGSNRLRLTLPSAGDDAGAMSDWAIGLYTVRVNVTREGLPTVSSAPVAMMLAPRITVSPLQAAPGQLALTLQCSPRLRPTQHAGARVVFGSHELPVDSIDTPDNDLEQPTTLHVTVPAAAALPGRHPILLRVDGVDSLPVKIAEDGLQFDDDQTVRIL